MRDKIAEAETKAKQVTEDIADALQQDIDKLMKGPTHNNHINPEQPQSPSQDSFVPPPSIGVKVSKQDASDFLWTMRDDSA